MANIYGFTAGTGNEGSYVTIGTTQVITGAKTFDSNITFDENVVSNASQPACSDSSMKVPTTAWVQSAISQQQSLTVTWTFFPEGPNTYTLFDVGSYNPLPTTIFIFSNVIYDSGGPVARFPIPTAENSYRGARILFRWLVPSPGLSNLYFASADWNGNTGAPGTPLIVANISSPVAVFQVSAKNRTAFEIICNGTNWYITYVA